MTLLSRDWEEQQIRGFTNICKKYLSKRNIAFNSITSDFKDGIKLLNFIEIISKSKISQAWNKRTISPLQEIDNLNIAINHLKEKDVKLTNIGANDIHDGNIKLICGLIFSCIQKFLIDKIEDSNEKATDALLIWCKRNTSKYNINIANFGQSWQNGLAFCALIHNFHPDLFNFDALTQGNAYKNWQTFIQACNSLGITSCFQIGDTNCRSSDLIKSQVTEIYYFINTTEKTQIFDILIEIMKKLSEFPHISTQLSSNFLTLYQNDYAIVQDLQQKCSKKDPKVSSTIQTLKSKFTNDIHDEIMQLENYIKVFCSSSANDKEKCKMIKEAAENLSKYNEYFQDSFHYVTSIIKLINTRIETINKNENAEIERRNKMLSDYKNLFDQTSQYLNGLQNKFESTSKQYKSSELNSMSNESNRKLKQLESKYEDLSSQNIQVNGFRYNIRHIRTRFTTLLRKIEEELKQALEREQKVASYIQLCESKLSQLNTLRIQFSINTNDRNKLNSINSNISEEISKLVTINSSYDELQNEQSLVDSKYHPDTILNKFITLSNKVKESIENIDLANLKKKSIHKNQLDLLNNAMPNILEKDQTSKIAKRILNLERNQDYPSSMTDVQKEYWLSPSVYDSPLYSDIHPPIMCNSQQERDALLHNIYKVPSYLQDYLGGERVIAVYSDKLSSPDDQGKIIRSPFDLGFQRNQDPNSLYNLVKSDKIEILQTDYRLTRRSGYRLFYIQFRNISNRRLYFSFQKGSIVDFPVNKQPLYIAETVSGYININETKEFYLKWFCMAEGKTDPDEDAKLTPFIFVAPERFCFTNNDRMWTPNNRIWWDNLQPEKSGNISKTNSLWTYCEVEKRIRRKSTISLDHRVEIGGIIDNELFYILLKKKNLIVSKIEGVIRYQYMSNSELANEMMIFNNQMGFVITIANNNQHILIEKTESGKWEGGICKYNSENDWYSYKDSTYYKDFSSISKSGFTVDSIISGMQSDPKYFDHATYNSQHSRQHLFGKLGIKVPLIHTGQIIIPSIHNLIDF